MFRNVRTAAAAIALVVIMGTPSAWAVTQTMTANIAFDSALSLTKNTDINFGTVKAGVADTYTISTGGAVSAAGSGAALYGTPTAGSITITGSATQLINISAGSYTADNGVTPQNATCSYTAGLPGTCTINGAAAPGAGKALLIGAQAVVDGSQAAGTSAAPTFVVTVVYQ